MNTKIFLKRTLISLLFIGILCVTIQCKKKNDSNQIPNQSDLHTTGLVEDTYEQLSSLQSDETIDSTIIPKIGNYKNLLSSVILNVPLPGNQGSYNSCVCWAVGYGLLGYHFKILEGHNDYTGDDKKFSPNFIWNQLNNGQNVGVSIYSSLSLIKTEGCCKLTYMPINVAIDVLPSQEAMANAANYLLTDFYRVKNDIDRIKFWISRGYPIVIGMEVDQAFQSNGESQFEKQSDGRLVWKKYTDDSRLKHSMLICGYDDNISSFKVLNSWGSGWGNQGYIWIDYSFFKVAVVNTFMIPSIYLGVIKRPFLTTTFVGDITANSALSGGNITSDWGDAIFERGICWNTNSNPTIFDSHTTAGAGTGIFTSNLTGLTANSFYYVRAYATNSAGISYGNELSFSTSSTPNFFIGQSYGGGTIFYIDGTGNHGLIAAPSNLHYAVWGCIGTSIPGTSTAIGTGQANTTIIVNGCNKTGIAARLCDDLVLNGYDDWFLPSIDELDLLCKQATFIGGIPYSNYWSSSEYTAEKAYHENFFYEYVMTDDKDLNYDVRPIRAF